MQAQTAAMRHAGISIPENLGAGVPDLITPEFVCEEVAQGERFQPILITLRQNR